MAITDTQKVDYLWKKLGYGATKSDTNANKKAPNEAISSPLLLRGDKVWKQASTIPTVQPGSSTGVVTVYPTSSPRETTSDSTATANRTWKTGLTDWIPPEIGSTYQVKIYIHDSGDASNAAANGDQVFATGSANNDEWFFDYQSGVIHFIGTNLPNGVDFTGKVVYVAGARYTGEFGVGASSTELGAFTFTDNRLQTTSTNEEIIIEPAGTGYVAIDSTGALIIPVGTTAQRPTGQTGMLRFNDTNDDVEVFNGTQWESVGATQNITLNEFSGDGSTTDFSLSVTSTTNASIVAINGAVQEPTQAYTISGTTLTFTEAPVTGDSIDVRNFFSGTSSTLDTSIIKDADNDTKIQVEESSDEDIIRFDTGGTERASISSTGVKFGTGGTAYEFPTADGSANTFLQTDGSGNLSFAAVSTDLLSDTTPQLGGGLDVNGEEITSASDGNIVLNPNGTGNIQLGATDVLVEQKIVHDGDTDTYLQFAGADDFRIVSGGIDVLKATGSEIAFNDGQANYDFRIEGDSESNLLFVDASTDRIGIGTNTPSVELDVVGAMSLTNTTTDDALLITTTEDSSSAGPVITLKRNSASVSNGDYLGQLKFKGENDADQEVVYAKITAKIQDDTDGTEDGLIEFANRKAGSNNITARLRSDSLQLINGTNLTVDGTSTFTGDVTASGDITAATGTVDADIFTTDGIQITDNNITTTRSNDDLILNPNGTGNTNIQGGLSVNTGASGVSNLGTIVEDATVSATAATGTISYDVTAQQVLFYTSNATADWTINITGNATNDLNALLAVGQSITIVHMVTIGANEFRNTTVQVDGTGTGVTTRWSGGVAPAIGHTNSVDSYSYTVIKTANDTFSVFASLTEYGT